MAAQWSKSRNSGISPIGAYWKDFEGQDICCCAPRRSNSVQGWVLCVFGILQACPDGATAGSATFVERYTRREFDRLAQKIAVSAVSPAVSTTVCTQALCALGTRISPWNCSDGCCAPRRGNSARRWGLCAFGILQAHHKRAPCAPAPSVVRYTTRESPLGASGAQKK